ncbi:MAG: alpha/beta hydrolase [Chloroflexi bacterium]|nr:MAG: alpha/beta hydrolase [Chloroflexota bacterium]
MVCHPGGPGFSATYFGDLAALWEQHTLIMLNPRGTGGSDRPNDSRAYQIDDYVSDVEQLRQHLGLERMLLLGHSHGGVVAMAYAATFPDRVRRLVLASTLMPFRPGPGSGHARRDRQTHRTALGGGRHRRARGGAGGALRVRPGAERPRVSGAPPVLRPLRGRGGRLPGHAEIGDGQRRCVEAFQPGDLHHVRPPQPAARDHVTDPRDHR